MPCYPVFLLVSACGYRLGVVSCEGLTALKTVGVPVFVNRCYIPRAEDAFTTSFREGLRSLPCVKVVAPAQAVTLLKGTIWSSETYPVAVDTEFLALEYGLRMVVSVTLVNADDKTVIWQSGRMTDEIHYYASPEEARPAHGSLSYRPADPLLYQVNEREAMIKLARRMASTAMEKLLVEVGSGTSQAQ